MNSSSNSNQKLRFRILECSSEDSQFPASELLSGSNQARGWQSQRFCPYPQQITLQFLTPVNLRKLQFLCHETKIPSKIELFIALPDSVSSLPHSELPFKRLGHLELDPNDQSNFQMRELKTIKIERPCMYLRLVFHKCFQNRLNFFNQVGMIAVGAFGEQFGNFNYPNKNLQPISAPLTHRDPNNPNNDIQSELDEVTLIKISELEEAKLRAVQNEEFDEAQRLKGELNRLRQLGNQVRHLEDKKAYAVENEDYEAAKAYKVEIDRFRGAITDVINGHRPRGNNFRDSSGFIDTQSQYNARGSTNDRSMNRTPSYQRPSINRTEQDRSMRHDESFHSFEGGAKGNAGRGGDAYNYQRKGYDPRQKLPSVVNFDEQVIPTLAKKFQQGEQPIEEEAQEQNKGHEVEELTPANQKLAAPLIPVLGIEICKKLFSKHWDHREQAIQVIAAEMPNPNSKIINTKDQWGIFVGTMGAVGFTLTDRVNQVSIKSMNLLKSLLIRKPPNPGPKNDFLVYMEMVLNGLLEKIGDNNSRIRDQAEEAILDMTKNPVISCPYCLSVILKDSTPKNKGGVQSAKHTIARLRLLQKLIGMFKIDNDQIPYGPVIDFCLEKLESPNADVRSVVINLLVDIYALVGERIRDDLTEVRPAQMEVLQREFDAVAKRNQKNPGKPAEQQRNTQGKK